MSYILISKKRIPLDENVLNDVIGAGEIEIRRMSGKEFNSKSNTLIVSITTRDISFLEKQIPLIIKEYSASGQRLNIKISASFSDMEIRRLILSFAHSIRAEKMTGISVEVK